MDAQSFVNTLEQDIPAEEIDTLYAPKEFVIDHQGHVRQAGADLPEGQFINDFKRKAERSLFIFCKAVLKRNRLTRSLHKPLCDHLCRIPPYRKLVLMPRDHFKTTVVSNGLPIHILVQPEDRNIYIPGMFGPDTRILIAGETVDRASKHLRWIETQFESNKLLRALWPNCVWENPRRQSKKWNEAELLLPRRLSAEVSDPTIQVNGVGGAITGAHVNVLIKDDLISVEARNSLAKMMESIDWHIASRALMDDPDKSLEFTIGTRWAVHDLYQYIEENDPSVEVRVWSIVENGKTILPEYFSLDTVARLQKEFGILFPLLYMNNATDPELVDFNASLVRHFTIVGDTIQFDEDGRDMLIRERDIDHRPEPDLRGMPLDAYTLSLMTGREKYVGMKYHNRQEVES